MSATTRCRVCVSGESERFRTVGGLDYWHCGTCGVVFLDSSQLPDVEGKRERLHAITD
jgi:ribosomal protein L37AE/L43A